GEPFELSNCGLAGGRLRRWQQRAQAWRRTQPDGASLVGQHAVVALRHTGDVSDPLAGILQEEQARFVEAKRGFAVYDLADLADATAQRAHQDFWFGIAHDPFVHQDASEGDDAPSVADGFPLAEGFDGFGPNHGATGTEQLSRAQGARDRSQSPLR